MKTQDSKKKPDIEFYKENSNILLIAPHGVESEPYDDIGTAELTRQIQAHLKCAAVINTAFRKPTGKDKNDRNKGIASLAAKVLNLNIVEQAKQVPGYIDKFEKITNLDGLTYVFWIHGIDDDNITKGIDCFIGYGQPNEGEEEHPTAEEAIIKNLIKQFQDNGIKADKAPVNSGYRGWNEKYMNQWFRIRGKGLDKIQSIQLEFKKTGFRRKKDLKKASADIAKTILALVTADDTSKTMDAKDGSKSESLHPGQEQPAPAQKIIDSDSGGAVIEVVEPDAMALAEINDAEVVEDENSKVEKAYQYLEGIFRKHIQSAMLECGQYLIKTFYNDDYNEAQKKKFTRNKSLAKLIKRIQNDAKEKGNVPSRTWVYDAVNLAIDHRLFKKKSLPSAYGQLGHSHKVKLTSAPVDIKITLAKEAVEKQYSVARLSERIKEEKEKDSDNINLLNLPPIEHLIIRPVKELDKLEKRAKREITVRSKALERYEEANKHLEAVIKEKVPTPEELKKAIKDNEWTVSGNNVNFQTGCSNGCIYCYGRFMPRTKELKKEAEKQGKTFKWRETKRRKNDVDANYSLKNGRVGFPTSHDITPDNLDDYLTVLGKLLRAGNDVLIITKPVPECIKAICQASRFFKDKILFRFTIGVKSEKLRKFWEPNAPSYKKRIEALEYAYDAGFQTSVSMEPMLEFLKAEEMVKDFLPFVTDAIWFGKMNSMKDIKELPAFKDLDGRLEEELKLVEEGHADENIKQLYEIYKDNPKIKWKLAFKDVLGISLPPAPGMDI